MKLIDQVLDFWYAGDFTSRRKAWFIKDPDFDKQIRSKFGRAVQAAAAGEYDGWVETANGALALIILLDQFPRNLYRNDAKSFATDAKALAVAKIAIEKGYDRALTTVQKIFLYLPFEHSENSGDQDRAVELCAAMGDPDFHKYAIAHRDVIAQFGRFPHRNAVLDRPSTAAEIEFMKTFNSF